MILIDTCILSSLSKIDKLGLLNILFRNHFCYITSSVLNELNANKIAGFKFVEKIEEMLSFTRVKNKICILSLESKELEEAYGLKNQYNLSLVDCECIVLAKSKNAILLTDDTNLGKVALKEGIQKVYDLKSLLEANIIDGKIKNYKELKEIIECLKQRDYYLFSESDLEELFEYLS